MPKRLAAPAASRKESADRRVADLLSERDKLMGEIALRARLKSLPPMLVKARTLLTRFWGRSNWDARFELLAVARMLLMLGAAQPALHAPRPPKRRERSSGQARRQQAAPVPRKIVETT